MRRRTRGPEPRIIDPSTHPKRFVSLKVAADYLDVDRKTLNIFLLDRQLAFVTFNRRRKIEVSELVAFVERNRTPVKSA